MKNCKSSSAPWAVILLAFCVALPPFAGGMDFDEASRLAVQAGGRKKPLDTFAAETLQAITGRRSVTDPETGKRLEPVDALFSIWLGKRDWKNAPIVLVSDPSVRRELSLPERRLFAFNELMANPRLAEYHHALIDKQIRRQDLAAIETDVETVLVRLDLLNRIFSGEAMAIVPGPDSADDRWTTPLMAAELYGPETANELILKLKALTGAYLSGDAPGFAAAAGGLRETLRALAPGHYPAAAAINREVHYNRLHPFRLAWMLYLGAFFLLLSRRTYKAGMTFFSLGLLMNIYGFVLRGWIAGRAPVTNMYETVVWTALGLALFAIVFEAIYRARYYALCAAPLAVLALILADLLPAVLNPAINPLPPVLRDNFWLVTHVVTIMLGYAAFALAFGLGHLVIGWYLFKPGTINDRSTLHHLLYRVLQIGILFLAAGTILGGVWANYSWGRFWGWDPKETWALIALLLYIFALHGKIAGWWGNFGMAVAASVCFNGVLMAWYGVNFVLGKGLHSYGFGGGGAKWVLLVVAIDLAFVGVCIFGRMHRLRPKLVGQMAA